MERKLEILMAVVDEYIDTGEPVGSVAVAQLMHNRVSSATIRNEMAALCDMGYLYQPHTSAGRVPTVKGYRAYIDALVSQKNDPADRKRIDEAVSAIRSGENAESDAAKALSELTGCATLTTSESLADPISCVEIIPHGGGLYTVLVATESGKLKSCPVRTESEPDRDTVRSFVAMVNDLLCGLPASGVTPAILQGMSVKLGEHFLQLAPFIGGLHEAAGLLAGSEVTLCGEKTLLQHPDFGAEQLRSIMAVLADRPLLSRILADIAGDRVAVVLGPESAISQLSGSALLTARYGDGEKVSGKLGVIAPIRINYRSIIPDIEYFRAGMDRLLGGKNTEDGNGRDKHQ